MKVILVKQVPKLGNAGDIIEVSSGYARNFLLPRQMANFATSAALQVMQQARVLSKEQQQRRQEKKQVLHNMLAGTTILVRANANAEGILFGGIGEAEIAASIAKRKKMEINPKNIILPHHLKTLGKHEVALKLGRGDKLNFFIDIQREENA